MERTCRLRLIFSGFARFFFLNLTLAAIFAKIFFLVYSVNGEIREREKDFAVWRSSEPWSAWSLNKLPVALGNGGWISQQQHTHTGTKRRAINPRSFLDRHAHKKRERERENGKEFQKRELQSPSVVGVRVSLFAASTWVTKKEKKRRHQHRRRRRMYILPRPHSPIASRRP